MNRFVLFVASAAALVIAGWPSAAQEKKISGVPVETYYLMPDFGDGMVYLKGQRPAQGKMNICAVDNTLRFLEKDGKEVSAGRNDDIIMVRIGDVSFLQDDGIFYRLYPVSGEVGVALRRSVTIMTDVKEGAYGTKSHTSSITEYQHYYADGVTYELNKDKEYPYTVSEMVFMYKGNEILPVNKRNLRKLFPERKAEIDAWFKEKHAVPDTVEEAQAFLNRWASLEE